MGAEVREILEDYVLLVFDIPANQSKMRKTVLKALAAMGAVMHTASCYLIPYGESSLELANAIATLGNVVVWVSKQKDPDKAKALTIKYEEHLKARCTIIEHRLLAIKEHVELEELGRAARMVGKTKLLIDQLKKISETFNPDWLGPRIAAMEQTLVQIYKKG